MPIYEYRCDNGHTFEVMQRMSDDPLAECTTCGASLQRVFHPVAVHFKGSGFYTTDYGKKGAGAKADSASSDSKSSDSKASDSTSSDSSNSSSDSKPASKASAKSSAD